MPTLTIAPGETKDVLASCTPGEAVTGGGLTNIPGEVIRGELETVSYGPQFDGQQSGWFVFLRNETTESITVSPGVSAICAPGTMVSQ